MGAMAVKKNSMKTMIYESLANSGASGENGLTRASNQQVRGSSPRGIATNFFPD